MELGSSDPPFFLFNMDKTITVRQSTWVRLTNLKTKLNCKTIDETLKRIFKMITKFKLEKELEGIQ